MRPIQPKNERRSSGSTPGFVSNLRKSSKRRCVSSACIPCRQRKSKCDGEQPNCSTCTAVYKTPCSYDLDSDYRRKSVLEKDIATLTGEKESLVAIIKAINSYSEAEVAEILDVIAKTLGKDVTLPNISNTSVQGDLSNQFIGRAAFEGGTVRTYGPSSSLGLVPNEETRPTQPENSKNWTIVARDKRFVDDLLKLYFRWVHPFYCFFSEDLFMDDMTNDRTGHCSSLLVNAILAVACHYSDSGEARSDPHDHNTAGDHFFAEAKRILNQNDVTNLTTVQALALMGLREASIGRPNIGFQYSGRCMRMSVELGLHLSVCSELDPRKLEARRITFWACFSCDMTWSIAIGRIAQLPRAAITVGKPTMREYHNEQLWGPWGDWSQINVPRSDQPTFTLRFLNQYSALSEIVNDTVFMFYAPCERFTSAKLLDFHGRYKRWFEKLPEEFHLRDVNTPHILTLHMYYHIVVLHLFRPFLKVDLTNPKVSPQEVCMECADTAAGLVATYRQLYGLRRVPVIVPHLILTSSIIHLLHLPNSSAAYHLAQSITSLREMTLNHTFSTRCLRIIKALAGKWNIQLPLVVEEAAADDSTGSSMEISPGKLPFISPIPNIPQNNGYMNGTIVSGNLPMCALASPLSYTAHGNVFWPPFGDGSVPLPSHSPVSPMNVSAVIHPRNDQWQELILDGFQVAAPDHRILQSASYRGNSHWA